jgi:pyridoxal phosphate enzyme (YggS family)
METNIHSLQENIGSVRNRIEKSAVLAGRNPAEIELIAVTKEKPPVVIKELFDCGIKKIGESYLKEALFKIGLLERYQIEWHMIGTIQTGKANQIIQTFDQVHSVDRLELARDLNSKAKKINITLPVYLECNVSGETTKHGLSAWIEDQWEMLIPDYRGNS